jgi:hypothetical protein
MAEKTANQQHGTGTTDYEESKGQHQQKEHAQKDQAKTGQQGGTSQHSGSNPQQEPGKREHSKGTQHNK